mmetsp:Transcript_10068/g.31914  ORF Transcript_10068/g.31914 Transcript_10068/m.31914 type:complete len:223 (+) Transcript_10068:1068-1736(+)
MASRRLARGSPARSPSSGWEEARPAPFVAPSASGWCVSADPDDWKRCDAPGLAVPPAEAEEEAAPSPPPPPLPPDASSSSSSTPTPAPVVDSSSSSGAPPVARAETPASNCSRAPMEVMMAAVRSVTVEVTKSRSWPDEMRARIQTRAVCQGKAARADEEPLASVVSSVKTLTRAARKSSVRSWRDLVTSWSKEARRASACCRMPRLGSRSMWKRAAPKSGK